MRAHAPSRLAVCLALTIVAPTALAADPVVPQGNYRLVLVGPFSETDLILTQLGKKGDAFQAQVLDTAPLPQPPQISQLSLSQEGALLMALKIGNVDAIFTGTPRPDGNYRGMIRIAAQSFPAKVEKTTAVKVTPPLQEAPPVFQTFMKARQEPDAKARTKSLQELVTKSPGDLTLSQVYATLLQGAEAGGLDAGTVKTLLNQWLEGAKSYGDECLTTVSGQALTALAGQKAFADLALDLARDVEKSLGADAPPQARAEVARALAEAARAAGKVDLATEAEGRLAKLEEELDAAYRKSIPPFKPERARDEAPRESKRVVLMELFTGAQCPPCVAADVAFDALHSVYEPTELVTLQYHLHIPGPDPLTNGDTEKRMEYYPDFGGTPTTFFDGKNDAMGGGQLPASEAKFNQFRQVIDAALKAPARAEIDLKVNRDGDAVKISARASVSGPDEGDAGKIGGSQPKLRLALVEEEVRYVGSNNLRFHHHVVRSMPGGVAGKAITNGKGQTEVTVKLSELRQSLETYLSDFVKEGRNFPKALPPIDLKKLKVVAFVQDDNDKAVLNAAMAEVPEAH
ncbi:MAG: hypothetical protein AB7I30_16920 [Isosphaeraceae bacterium]